MLNGSRVFMTGRLPVRLKWIVLGWLVAETLAFLLLVQAIGFGNTLLLGLATTVLGLVMMRRLGTEAMGSLQRSLDGRQPPAGAMAEGMLAALGAALLILPGFVANFIGLALAAPSVRRKAVKVFNGDAAPHDPRLRAGPKGVIDLGPGDWRPVDRP